MNQGPAGGRPLAQVLQQLAAELQAQQPPPGHQAQVAGAVSKVCRQRKPARPGRTPRWAWTGGALASLVLGLVLWLPRLPPPLPILDSRLQPGDFVPLAPAERWPRGSHAAWLVSTELPRERLAALGLPHDPARADDAVRAELLLHPSGEVLAVRFLN